MLHLVPKHLFLIVDDAHFLKQDQINVFQEQLPNQNVHVILLSQNMTDALRIMRSSIEYTSAWLFQYHHTALEMMRSAYGENDHSNQDVAINYNQHFFSVDGSPRCIVAHRAIPRIPHNPCENQSVQCELDMEDHATTSEQINSKWSFAYRAHLRRQKELRAPSFLTGCLSLLLDEDEFVEAHEDLGDEKPEEEEDDGKMEDDDSEKTQVQEEIHDDHEWSATDQVNLLTVHM